MHDSRSRALATLPAHPVFCTDLDAGVVAVAIRFHTRNQNDGHFPSPSTCAALLALLELAAATPLSALVDFSPLTVLLDVGNHASSAAAGDPHDALDCLAQLAMNSWDSITPDDPHEDVAIERLLGALHLALFGTIPTAVRGLPSLGCSTCAEVRYAGGASWIARVVGEAHSAGRLAPGYRCATALEAAAHDAEYTGPFSGIREHGVLRLAVRAAELVATLTTRDVHSIAYWNGALIDRARALGVLPPAPTPPPPALEVA